MKVILLAGGLGTRISEYTNMIPKPMVPIDILIMDIKIFILLWATKPKL